MNVIYENSKSAVDNKVPTKDHSLFIGRFYDKATTYVKDGKIIKNRGNKERVIAKEIEHYNNIIIEHNGLIDIYCNEEKARNYIKIGDKLKKYYFFNGDFITIHIGRNTKCE